jgi:hypothetical protein
MRLSLPAGRRHTRIPTIEPTSHAFCLAFHAVYRCRHTGACCTAGWDIPAEAPVVTALTTHLAGSAQARAFALARTPDGGAILARTAAGACVFFATADGRRCEVHRDLGEAMLPSACRQFPRVTLAEPRGRRITLSHFCPTAASLLFTTAPIAIVSAPPEISLHGSAEGLDATATLPPLLRADMLMDVDGYDAWERHGLHMLSTRGRNVREAMAALGGMTAVVQRWSPADGSLCDWVMRAAADATDREPPPLDDAGDSDDYALALSSVPEGLAIPLSAPPGNIDYARVETICGEHDGVIRRYLAAKLFGCWWPYFDLDLGSVLSAVQLHASVLRVRLGARLAKGDHDGTALLEAVRETDLLMVHLADLRSFADRCALQGPC